MNLFEQIKQMFSNFSQRRKEHKLKSVREMASHEALHSFNIDAYNGEPVITSNHIVISVPQKNVSGEQLIDTMLKLREIYIESKL